MDSKNNQEIFMIKRKIHHQEFTVIENPEPNIYSPP